MQRLPAPLSCCAGSTRRAQPTAQRHSRPAHLPGGALLERLSKLQVPARQRPLAAAVRAAPVHERGPGAQAVCRQRAAGGGRAAAAASWRAAAVAGECAGRAAIPDRFPCLRQAMQAVRSAESSPLAHKALAARPLPDQDPHAHQRALCRSHGCVPMLEAEGSPLASLL